MIDFNHLNSALFAPRGACPTSWWLAPLGLHWGAQGWLSFIRTSMTYCQCSHY